MSQRSQLYGKEHEVVPKPLLSADAIFDEALRVLAEDGAPGLTIRNLAARLRCSNKTLYQQVGTYDVMIRGVVARAFAQLKLAFSTDSVWEVAVESWCTALRTALLEHPDLCTLMTVADRDVIFDYGGELIAVLRRDGFADDQALQAAGLLAHVTLSMTLSDIAAPGEWDDPSVFATTIRWLIHGMAIQRAEEFLRHDGRFDAARRSADARLEGRNAS